MIICMDIDQYIVYLVYKYINIQQCQCENLSTMRKNYWRRLIFSIGKPNLIEDNPGLFIDTICKIDKTIHTTIKYVGLLLLLFVRLSNFHLMILLEWRQLSNFLRSFIIWELLIVGRIYKWLRRYLYRHSAGEG